MTIGAFSVSLSVKDLAASRDFYSKIGFQEFAGEQQQGWLIMRNGDCVIGLFQGMFERNTLTFNPGWDQDARRVDIFEDVRDIQKRLRKDGIEPDPAADESGQGPASFMIMDPDGNPILFDQHV